jgi:hypothetical protein
VADLGQIMISAKKSNGVKNITNNMYKKQIIFADILFLTMGSDIISHRIAIGLFYHKISIACKKMSFIHFRFSDILFSLYVRFYNLPYYEDF